jgi:hypothetical protein
MPHWKLLLGVSPLGAARGRIPSPTALRVEPVELALQLAGGYRPDVTRKIAIDVIGMHFCFDERAVEENILDPNAPKLLSHIVSA